jgi:hypothetical protein
MAAVVFIGFIHVLGIIDRRKENWPAFWWKLGPSRSHAFMGIRGSVLDNFIYGINYLLQLNVKNSLITFQQTQLHHEACIILLVHSNVGILSHVDHFL